MRKKVFTSMGQVEKKFFPKDHKKKELEAMTVEERANYDAMESLKIFKKALRKAFKK